ncbi:unnamed protein product [Protopolystoma xenopodis]|uniref:Uncharacterized protein n=1 Tax=Protopolystoma xenopodis TaxID=117903 RepID=A0A3S5C7D1_9PLAT|nr:unnamed protein product [Protopolystoma xenopodis]
MANFVYLHTICFASTVFGSITKRCYFCLRCALLEYIFCRPELTKMLVSTVCLEALIEVIMYAFSGEAGSFCPFPHVVSPSKGHVDGPRPFGEDINVVLTTEGLHVSQRLMPNRRSEQDFYF